jgi:hypothetical protein
LIRSGYRFASRKSVKTGIQGPVPVQSEPETALENDANLVGCGGGLQMNFLTIGLDEEIPDCQRCGNKPRLICKTLDTKKGETVRIFLCKCGGTTRTSRDPHERSVQRQFG